MFLFVPMLLLLFCGLTGGISPDVSLTYIQVLRQFRQSHAIVQEQIKLSL